MRYHGDMEQYAQQLPRAFAALEAFPALRASVEVGLRRQAARIGANLARFQERPRLSEALAAALRDPRGGLITLEGPPGSGVTSLLAALAVRAPLPIWLAADAPDAITALYAQLVALHRPAVPLLDPTVSTDPAALEQLLTEAAAARSSVAPIALLIDDLAAPGQPLRPGPTPLPAELPRGVVLLFGCAPDAPTPYPPTLRMRLPDDDPELHVAQTRALAALGCDPAWSDALVGASAGNFLYLGLALARLRSGELEPGALPAGLDALLSSWWDSLAGSERRLAAVLAAAGEPLPLPLAAELTGADPDALLARWEQLGLIDLQVQASARGDERGSAAPLLLAAFAHSAAPALLARVAQRELTAAHQDLAVLALAQAENASTRKGAGRQVEPTPVERYLGHQLARHAALALEATRDTVLPRIVSRERLLAEKRDGRLAEALDAARWELRAAASVGPALRLVRATIMAGVLATGARDLAPEAAGEALSAGLERGGREPSLRRVLDSVERLPDGHAKALILRRLGEICYNNRMRSAAMRLLSRALDLEATPNSRAWRDSREALFATLAEAALELGGVEVALEIAERTEHLERRAMIETHVVRRLLATGERDRAQKLARSILHEGMGVWARAEVGVELLRAGDARGAMLLEELTLETVSAWAQIELACDDVGRDEAAARARIDALPSQGQRDRGLARLARALASVGDDGGALAAAEAISAVDVRVAALIDLRLGLEGLVAMLALERATRDIGAVTGDDRVPLVVALAAALAALGRRERALALADELPAGEERDRALARVAVALAQRGDHAEARELLAVINDDDERAWAYEEFARLLAAEGRWDEAMELVGRISADDQRAQAAADLAVERARVGEVIAALAMALAIELPAERARALALIAPPMVAAGFAAQALAVASHPETLAGVEARGRYLAAVAVALAEHGQSEAAAALMARIGRPTEQARVGAGLARALVGHSPELALAALGDALRAATVGREEALRALELAAPALAALGGAALLGEAAAAVDEIDRWV